MIYLTLYHVILISVTPLHPMQCISIFLCKLFYVTYIYEHLSEKTSARKNSLPIFLSFCEVK